MLKSLAYKRVRKEKMKRDSTKIRLLQTRLREGLISLLGNLLLGADSCIIEIPQNLLLDFQTILEEGERIPYNVRPLGGNLYEFSHKVI